METNKTSKTVAFAGIITAATASICCITPVLAMMAGTTGLVTSFSWVEPYRPYLIGITIIALVFAWVLKLKPKSQYEIDCACADGERPSFWQSKKLLGSITLVSLLLLAFPYYSDIFFPQPNQEIGFVQSDHIMEEVFKVKGMTCTGCENHIESEVAKLTGILSVKANYKEGNTRVKYDATKVSKEQISKAIKRSGYTFIE